jgi:hypothetical protein
MGRRLISCRRVIAWGGMILINFILIDGQKGTQKGHNDG